MPLYSIVLRDKNGREMLEGLRTSFRSSVEYPDQFEAELLMQFCDLGGLSESASRNVQTFEVYEQGFGKSNVPEDVKPCLVRSRDEMFDSQRKNYISIGL